MKSVTIAQKVLPPAKKIDLKAPIKVSMRYIPRLTANHNETLLRS
jgi:hypothetical protein